MIRPISKVAAALLLEKHGGAVELDYKALWKHMADLVAELRKSGEPVPSVVIRDLRSAKTMIEILKMDPSRAENILRIEEYLSNVESYLVPAAKRRFGESYIDEWMSKVVEAQKGVQTWKPEPSLRFSVGVPRGQRWVRIKPSEEISVEKVKQLCRQIGLKHRTEKDGYVLIYGEEERVKNFINKTAELLRERGGSPPKKAEAK